VRWASAATRYTAAGCHQDKQSLDDGRRCARAGRQTVRKHGMDRHQNLLPRQILRKGFYRLEGIWRTKKPARRPVVYRPDESERSPADDPGKTVPDASTPSGPRPAAATDIETTSPWDRWRVVALPRIAFGHAGFLGRRPSAFFTPS